VKVTNDGNVVPWLLSAKALIHNGCTTGVEAFEMRVPAISYRATVNETYDSGFYRLPNALSHNCFSFAELRNTLQRIVQGALGAPNGENRRALVRRHLAAQEGPLACERMVDVLEQIASDQTRPLSRSALRRFERWLTTLGLHGIRNVKSWLPGSHNRPEFQRHRYPGLPLEEVSERLARFQRCWATARIWRSSRSRRPSIASERPDGRRRKCMHLIPPLIIPVENQVREMDPKLLLACLAARRGFTSIIGSHREIDFRIASFPRGLYLNKSMTNAISRCSRSCTESGMAF